MEDGNGVKDSKQQEENGKAKVAPVLKTSVNPAGTSADLPCHYPSQHQPLPSQGRTEPLPRL